MIEHAIARKNILVVDDDPFVCETVVMILKFDGHQVQYASNGAQALAAFEPSRFDLVITDLFMPAMKGDELAKAIKKRSPSQPVMMLTAYPEKIVNEGAAIPSVDYLMSKPFELEGLRAVITKLAPIQNPDHLSQN